MRPSGVSSNVCTSSTTAWAGPLRAQATIAATPSSGPSNTASTVPSGQLRTQPATPWRAASRRQVSRKKTPCTCPLTGSLEQIKADVAEVAEQGVTELFVDLNFDGEIGVVDADPAASMARAHELLDALAPS